jgi:hypothetical protein
MATIAAETAAASIRAASTSSSRMTPRTRRPGGSTSRIAQTAASANMLVACPLGRDWPIPRPTTGLSTYSVRPTAAGTATAVRTAPDHRRAAAQARISVAVMSANGTSVPRPGSQDRNRGK